MAYLGMPRYAGYATLQSMDLWQSIRTSLKSRPSYVSPRFRCLGSIKLSLPEASSKNIKMFNESIHPGIQGILHLLLHWWIMITIMAPIYSLIYLSLSDYLSWTQSCSRYLTSNIWRLVYLSWRQSIRCWEGYIMIYSLQDLATCQEAALKAHQSAFMEAQPAAGCTKIKLIKWFWSWDYQCIYVVDDRRCTSNDRGEEKSMFTHEFSESRSWWWDDHTPHYVVPENASYTPQLWPDSIPWEWVFPSKFQVPKYQSQLWLPEATVIFYVSLLWKNGDL